MLEEANSSKLAKLISKMMMLMIFFSTLMFMLESVRSIQEQNPQVFVISETVCILLGWVKRLFGSFERRLNDVNDGVVVWRVNDRLKCAPQTCP